MKSLSFLFIIAGVLSSILLNAAAFADDKNKDKAVIEKYQKALEEVRLNKAVAGYLKQELFISITELLKYIAVDTYVKPDPADKKDDEKYKTMKGKPSNPDMLYEKYCGDLDILYPRWRSVHIEDIIKQAEMNLQEAERKLAFLESNDIIKKYREKNPAGEEKQLNDAEAAAYTYRCITSVINGICEKADKEKNKQKKYAEKREKSREKAADYNYGIEIERRRHSELMSPPKILDLPLPQGGKTPYSRNDNQNL